MGKKLIREEVERGVSLIELLVVLGVIGVIMGGVFYFLGGMRGKVEGVGLEVEVSGCMRDLEGYRERHGWYPGFLGDGEEGVVEWNKDEGLRRLSFVKGEVYVVVDEDGDGRLSGVGEGLPGEGRLLVYARDRGGRWIYARVE